MPEPAIRKGPKTAARHTPPRPGARVPLAWSAALALVFLACYLAVAPHATADEDAAEFTLALVTRGVVHPTGYPIWTLVGSTFVALLRSLGVGYAYAVNSFSAIAAAVALFLLHRLVLAWLPPAPAGRGARFAIASVPVALLAFNPQWVVESTVVEVHAWHVAWLCATALWFTTLVRETDATSWLRMVAWGALCGLGISHHTTSVLFSTPMTVALGIALRRERRLRPVVMLQWLAGTAVPLMSYAWVLWRARHPAAASVWPTLEPTWRGLFDHMTGKIYRGFIGGWHPDPKQAAVLASDVYPVLLPALALAIVAAMRTRASSERLVRVTLLGGVFAQLAFVYRYGVADPAAYFLPPLAMTLPAVAETLWPVCMRAATGVRTRNAFAMAAVVFAALGVWGIRAGIENRRNVAQDDRLIRSMWRAVPDRPGIFLWPADSYYVLKLYQQLEGDKPQVGVYNSLMLSNSAREAAEFQRAYGFDPLANNGPEHVYDVIPPEYMVGQHALVDPRYLGRINMTIADSAKVPVMLFDNVNMRLRVIGKGRATSGS